MDPSSAQRALQVALGVTRYVSDLLDDSRAHKTGIDIERDWEIYTNTSLSKLSRIYRQNNLVVDLLKGLELSNWMILHLNNLHLSKHHSLADSKRTSGADPA